MLLFFSPRESFNNLGVAVKKQIQYRRAMKNSSRGFTGLRSIIPLCCVIVICLFGSLGCANAQLIFADSFDYPDGEIVGAPGSPWVNNYLPTNQAFVVSNRLYLTQTNQESVRVDFPTSYNSGLLYSRMTVNFSKLPDGDGNYFAFFRAAGTDNLRGRIWASTNGAAPGKFRLGITAISSPPVMVGRDLFLGTNYTLVCRYELAHSFSTLWIDPSDESDTASRADDLIDQGQWTIGHYGFLQTVSVFANSGNYIGALTVDDLRVGRTFAEVLPLVKFLSITNVLNGVPGMSAIGQATTNYVLQASTNLLSANWVNISTNTAGTNGMLNLTDPSAPGIPNRFYRLMKQ